MRQLTLPVAMLSAVFAVGIAWYAFVEGFTLLEAVYQAVTTLSTVGFDEVRPLDDSGRIFTIVFILVGIGLMFYTATALVETVVAGEVREMLGRRRSGRKVQRMEQHVILCGFGRVGQEIASEFERRGVDFVVVDRDQPAIDEATERGFPAVHGDATEEAVLLEAHIERAHSLVAAADSDVGNTYIVLTARSLNEDLYIVGRAGSPSAEQRMLTAGGNRIVSPYRIAGRRIAWSVVQPFVIDFVDVLASRRSEDDHVLAEIIVDESSGLHGRTVANAFQNLEGLSLLGVERPEGELVIGPSGAQELQNGDRLMVYGDQQALERLSGIESSVPRRS